MDDGKEMIDLVRMILVTNFTTAMCSLVVFFNLAGWF